LALALASALPFSAALATTLTSMDYKELAVQAEVAVVGKVIGSRTTQTDNGIATITTFEVASNAWGAEGKSTLEVISEGGSFKSGRYQLSEGFAGQLLPAKGQMTLLFLNADSQSGKLTIVGFNQGSLQVVKGGNGNQVILPGAGLMSLEAAMAEIKSAKLAPAANDLAR
jgi:hypothetical protein